MTNKTRRITLFFMGLLIIVLFVALLPECVTKYEISQKGKKVEVLINSIECKGKNNRHIEIFYNNRIIKEVSVDYSFCKKKVGDKIYMIHLEKYPDRFLSVNKSVLSEIISLGLILLMGAICIIGSFLLPDIGPD